MSSFRIYLGIKSIWSQGHSKVKVTHQPEVDDIVFPLVYEVCVEDDVAVPTIQAAMMLLFQLNHVVCIAFALDSVDLKSKNISTILTIKSLI